LLDAGATESLAVFVNGQVKYTIQNSSISSPDDNRTRTYEVILKPQETDLLNEFLNQKSIKKLPGKFRSKEKLPGRWDFSIEIVRGNKKQMIQVIQFSPTNHYPNGLLDLMCRIDDLKHTVTQGLLTSYSWCRERNVQVK
jgi:hypothetical protein